MKPTKTKPAPGPLLTQQALNRALLARQFLLERADVTPTETLTRLVGMQAQVPQSPYVGLWSRLANFDPESLSSLVASRQAVRIAAMRSTVHLLTADDALMLRPLHQPWLDRMLMTGTPFGRAIADKVDLPELIAIGRAAIEAKPMTLAELRKLFAARWPDADPASMAYAFHYSTPLVQLPPRGLWRRSGAPRCTTLNAWLGRPLATDPSPEAMVRRYLAGFGPASVQDAQAWSGLTRLTEVFDRLRPELITFTNESGRELFDLPDAPRPDPETPAPPRFLPEYDNLTLGHADRSRVIVGAPAVPPPQSVGLRAFLINGRTAGFWKVEEGKGTATLLLAPFEPLAKRDLKTLMAEGELLVRFMAPDAASCDVRLGEVY